MYLTLLLNRTHGGFSLSEAVVEQAIENGMSPEAFEQHPNSTADGWNEGSYYRNLDADISEIEFRSDDRLVEAAKQVKREGGYISPSGPEGDETETVQVVKVDLHLQIESSDGKESVSHGSIVEHVTDREIR